MKPETYVKKITGKIIGSRKRKKDIGKQLLTEIQERMNQGEAVDQIIADMGSVTEIADSFNENVTKHERNSFRLKKILVILAIILAALGAAAALCYWYIPRKADIHNSRVFQEAEVKAALLDAIGALEQEDYEKLQRNATDGLQTVFAQESMEAVKKQIMDDWGERTMTGNIYMQEIVQMNHHYAACQVNVTYENIGIAYTITFDEHMKLAGFYLR